MFPGSYRLVVKVVHAALVTKQAVASSKSNMAFATNVGTLLGMHVSFVRNNEVVSGKSFFTLIASM